MISAVDSETVSKGDLICYGLEASLLLVGIVQHLHKWRVGKDGNSTVRVK